MSNQRRRLSPALPNLGFGNRPKPTDHWSTRIAFHGLRVLLLVATAAAIHFLFPAPRLPDTAVLERGVVAPRDVVAEFSFEIPKSEAELGRDRAEAASGVAPRLEFLPGASAEMVGSIRNLFVGIDSLIVFTDPEERRDSLRVFLARERLSPSAGAVTLLLQPGERRELRVSMETAVEAYFPRGVLSTLAPREGVVNYVVRGMGDEERLVPRDSIIAQDAFLNLAAGRLPGGARPELADLQRLVLIRLFQPSLAYDERGTELARESAREAVNPVRATVLEGEKIVGAREQISEREEERLRAYRAAMIERGMDVNGGYRALAPALGSLMYNVLVLAIIGVLLFLFRAQVYGDFRSVVLLSLLVAAVTGAAALIARWELPAELIPVTFAALVVAALWDGRLALVFALLLAMLIGGQTPFQGLTASFSAMLGGAAAAFSVGAVHRRSKTWLFVSVISLAYAAAALTIGLMRSREASEVLTSMGWGAVNAVVASLLAIGFLPLFEAFTRITTSQTLLELSDLNRKLLKRLSFEASGTYHHTINVANLAEVACHAIGANGLLARVGAYYHDIGKLVKPQYFVENQPKGRNPHDKLKPSMSASIIRSHVTEGVRLAQEERLPGIIQNFIKQHHGTQQISFFLDRARELDPEAHVNVAEFTYPGPKPQTRETAVLMLADSVESAARVLQEPTPERLRDLVERIVAGKIAHGQLDESPLTLRDIEVVKQQLAHVLNGMYHHRIDYPAQPAALATPTPEEVAAVNLASTS